MTESSPRSDLHVERDGAVALVEIRRPPHNFFDIALTRALADTFEALDADPAIRASVLCSQGTAFCAGADFSGGPNVFDGVRDRPVNPLYDEGLRIFACAKPIVAAVQGAAVGGGLGLALAADFRVTCEEARFSANFARLGVHPGFGLSVTLPRLVGAQRAALLMMTGRRVGGAQAVAMGLADELTLRDLVRARALSLAAELAASAPLAVESIRGTLRAGLVDEIRAAVRRETAEQQRLAATEDFREGVAAMAARRAPVFRRR
jgi:enoyl-CoA hydratase/carnithine racemase